MMDAIRWAPTGLAAWIFKVDQRPAMVKLRVNGTYSHEIAAKLIEEKRQELKHGAAQRDVLTLLGWSSCFRKSRHAVRLPGLQSRQIPP